MKKLLSLLLLMFLAAPCMAQTDNNNTSLYIPYRYFAPWNLYISTAEQTTTPTTYLNAYHVQHDVGTPIATTDFALLYMDVARSLRYALCDLSGSGLSYQLDVTGLNQFGEKVKETTTLTVASNYVVTVAGSQPFVEITGADLTLLAGTPVNTNDRLYIGAGPKIGLPCPVAGSADVYRANISNVRETVGTVNTVYNTYDPTNAIAGTQWLTLYIHSRDRGVARVRGSAH